jgi:ATP-dependent Clp protease ATP-binding subunit ClpA
MVPARFTERARQIINYAHEEAIKLNHSQVDTEHLLLGLVREGLRDGQGMGAQALQELGVRLDNLETEVKKIIKKSHALPDSTRRQLLFTRAANQVLQFSMEEAQRLEYDHVGTDHILLGLIRERNGIAARVLASFNVTLEKVRRVSKSSTREGIKKSKIEIKESKGELTLEWLLNSLRRDKAEVTISFDKEHKCHGTIHRVGKDVVILKQKEDDTGIIIPISAIRCVEIPAGSEIRIFST